MLPERLCSCSRVRLAVCACVCRALEEAVYDEANHEEECSREHVARALLRIDLDMSDKVAQQVSTVQCAAAVCWQRSEARGGLPARLLSPVCGCLGGTRFFMAFRCCLPDTVSTGAWKKAPGWKVH
jgi:hypothetical protein